MTSAFLYRAKKTGNRIDGVPFYKICLYLMTCLQNMSQWCFYPIKEFYDRENNCSTLLCNCNPLFYCLVQHLFIKKEEARRKKKFDFLDRDYFDFS